MQRLMRELSHPDMTDDQRTELLQQQQELRAPAPTAGIAELATCPADACRRIWHGFY
jgi:hypothetical protein